MFKITKDLSPEKVTGYTYQGNPIVLSRKRGRPPRTRAKPGWYPLEKKIHAACVYGVTGSLKEVTRLTDIPENQLKNMMQEPWWLDTIKQIRREENDLITAKMTTIIDGTLDAMQDRIQNGDHYLDNKYTPDPENPGKFIKTREIIRVPVKLKDLPVTIGILTDKRQLLRGEATSITGKTAQEDILKELAGKFENFAKALNIKEPQTLDITDVEEITDGKEQEDTVREEWQGQRPEGNEGGIESRLGSGQEAKED